MSPRQEKDEKHLRKTWWATELLLFINESACQSYVKLATPSASHLLSLGQYWHQKEHQFLSLFPVQDDPLE